ncbi:HAD family hydrolase [Nocardia sp. BSTN01]|uniref:HAD family hydrolase n=1 Tax=Nocardia sp. BSTN01 TaxID=2783665 RepID=UPI00188E2144|nr:HAD-IA family hydrolase [Nocardia sp. BSTN01]MBF5000391.1 HAD family hydrolase [Nocardia sp. BSTN01]
MQVDAAFCRIADLLGEDIQEVVTGLSSSYLRAGGEVSGATGRFGQADLRGGREIEQGIQSSSRDSSFGSPSLVAPTRLASPADIAALIGDRTLIFDFDGPVCSLFSEFTNVQVSDIMRRSIRWRFRFQRVSFPPKINREKDPFEVLRYVAKLGEDFGIAGEKKLSALEVVAARTAKPTPYAHELIRTASKSRDVVFASNNATAAVKTYLATHDLDRYASGVFGRSSHILSRLKPDRFLLEHTLSELGLSPDQVVYIGDSTTDVMAAHASGIRAIAYANKPGKLASFMPYEPEAVVDSMSVLLRAL